MKVYLSAPHSNWFLDAMKVYLAGLSAEEKRANIKNDFAQKIYVLESFFYVKPWMEPYVKNHWEFILDSGAFTFMESKPTSAGTNWDTYTDQYIDYVNRMGIDLFFELDIDSVEGIKKVEKLRRRIESKTGKQSIPVWHKSRGLDYWKGMVGDYNYVAIGGIANGEIKKNQYPFFAKLLSIAKENNCKVHGLGFTNMEGLKKYRFDSVDSTAWIYGNRGGFLYRFTGNNIDKIKSPEGKRLRNKEAAIHNFREWVKFQKYAEKYL